MTRPKEIALSYATGTVPTYTLEEMVSRLEDLAAEEGVTQDRADLLAQAARRLKVTMTGPEIQARLYAIKAALPASAYLGAAVTDSGRIFVYATPTGYSADGSIEATAEDWPAALDILDARIAAGEGIVTFIEGLAKTLLSGGKLAEADEARFGDKARARAREMALAFTQSQAEG